MVCEVFPIRKNLIRNIVAVPQQCTVATVAQCILHMGSICAFTSVQWQTHTVSNTKVTFFLLQSTSPI